MYTPFTAVDRLTLLVQRILDTDALCDADGDMLLTEAVAARLSLEIGDTAEARHHVAQVARYMETLVASNTLTISDGNAVLEMARCILTGSSDGTGLPLLRDIPRNEEESNV
jgi:hypothetical protein